MKKQAIAFQPILLIDISLRTTADRLIEQKRLLREYAEELDWEVHTDKEGTVSASGVRMYYVSIRPKGGKKVSPEYFRKNKDKLLGFAMDIVSNIMDADATYAHTFGFMPNSLSHDDKEKIICANNFYGGLLSVKYKLTDRIKLEEEDKNLAEYIFMKSLGETLRSSFKVRKKRPRLATKKQKEQYDLLKEVSLMLKRLFNITI